MSFKVCAPGKHLAGLLGLLIGVLRTLGSGIGQSRAPGLASAGSLAPSGAGSAQQLRAWMLSFLHGLRPEILLWVLSGAKSPLAHWCFLVEQRLTQGVMEPVF